MFPSHPSCTSCDLYRHASHPGVPTVVYHQGEQGGDALIVLGQNPGFTEDQHNEPFLGKAGRNLKRIYLAPLLKRHPGLTVYLTNAIRCGPQPEERTSIINVCFPLHTTPDLHKIVGQEYKRIAILATGAVAAKAMSLHILGDKKAQSLIALIRRQPIPAEIDGHPVTCFATYHSVLRDGSLIHAVARHIELLHSWLSYRLPYVSRPYLIPPHPPTRHSPRTISLDIETYGFVDGLPEQNHFHPALCLARDKVQLDDLVQTVAITLPETDPCETSSSQMLSSKTPNNGLSPCRNRTYKQSLSSSSVVRKLSLSKLQPAWTMIFVMSNPRHRELLAMWLTHTSVLIGMNLLFDLMFLRACGSKFATTLCGRHLIVDVSILNSLDLPSAPERTLKQIAQALGIASDWSPNRRFPSDTDPDFHLYNATDTHVSLLVAAELARRIGE